MIMDKKIFFSAVSIIYIIALLAGSFIVKPNSVMPGDSFDGLAHFLGFFALSVLLFLTLRSYKVKNNLVITLLLSLFISIIVEVLRIPGRGFGMNDLAVNVLGLIVGSVLAWSFSRS
jgi:VanZ family protein